MSEQLVHPEDGLPVEVIEPGSSEDPFSGKNQQETSAPASKGAPQEPTVQPTEGNPAQTVPTQTPITEPTVQVIPANQAPATPETVVAPETETAPTVEEEVAGLSTEEEEALKTLSEVFTEQSSAKLQEALSKQQSTYDKQIAAMNTTLESIKEQDAARLLEIRELRTQGLSDEERDKVMKTYAQDDKATQLLAYENELTGFHKELMVLNLLQEFESFGVKQGDIESYDSPEEMQAYCLEQKADFLEKKLEETSQTQVVSATAQSATPTTEKPAEQPAPQVPAGAQAPSDVGSGGATPQEKNFSTDQSSDALLKNMKSTNWDTINIR